MDGIKTYQQLVDDNERLSRQLEEANEAIHAIQTGQVDALVIHGKDGHELYALKTADQTYRVFIETMNEGAVTLNAEGLIIYANSMFASMVGQPLSAVIGVAFRTFVAPGSAPAYADLFRMGWEEDNKIELFIEGSRGPIPCQLSVNVLELDEGMSLSMILTDLTTQKESQRLLERKNRQLAQTNAALEISNHDLLQFASVASHDLQEPLRKIQIFSGLLKERHKEELPGDSLRYLQKIIDSSNRMKTMIVDILTYSRLSTNDSSFERTDLTELVNDVLTDFDLLISDKKVVVEVGSLPTAEVNRGQMRQVFHNLISNAMKFSQPGRVPRLTISGGLKTPAEGEPAWCQLEIADNGIGFNDQYAEKVFTLFHRLNTKDAYEGSGIGLAIAKRIIDRHRGIIRAASKESEGTTFVIELPLEQRHNPFIGDEYAT